MSVRTPVGVLAEVALWRNAVQDLVEDLAVVEGALVESNGDQVDKAQSLRWIERTRARLAELAVRMATLEFTEGS